ncbi:MAG: HAD family hydrolase [Butyrivibrio sp.]|nr:HAD family hydrolase [Butyrivibrio sp.]
MIGLTSEAAKGLLRDGYGNTQVDNTAKTTKDILRENIFTYFNLIFAIMAVLVIIAGDYRSLTFLPVVIANALIGIYQELQAKKVLDNLAVIHEATVTAIRDGQETIVPVDQLVLGDVIVLRSGNQICADAVVLQGEIAVNEALLTGEADEIVKTTDSELMSGSFVVSGECLAQLTRVGTNSYISKLMLKAKKMPSSEQSEMVKSINRLVIAAGIIIIPIGITLFTQSYVMQGNDFKSSVISMVAALVGMIPEGLYLLVSIALGASAVRLAMKKIMLHDMRSIETLARVDTLCVDKTGTITDNSMLVADVVPVEDIPVEVYEGYKELVSRYIGVLPDDNITMKALEDYFGGRISTGCISFHSFSSKYKYSSVQFAEGTFVLGAPEFLLGKSFDAYRDIVNTYAGKGLRVLVFGQYYGGCDGVMIQEQESTGKALSLPVPQTELTNAKVVPLLFILLQNPVRETAPETFEYFVKQGVEVKVISGDNPVTVSEVARTAGILNYDKYVDASTLSDEELRESVLDYTIYGRVSPEQKQKIVRALKAAGRTVAMTGDGVNDILAMKDADCSIAMAAGSDAAVQAAQVVLLDSDFAHMPEIVSEGRRDINNIERSTTLFLVKNIFSILLALFSIVSVMTYPLAPSQVSLISLFNIGIPAFFLAMEPNTKRIKGHFLSKVLLRAMPAALTDFFAIAALVVFGETFGVSASDVSVASTFLLAIVGFMILANISEPMNRYRITVLIGCVIGVIFTAFFLNDLFAISYISKECIMLFVLFAIATEPCMRYLTLLGNAIENKIKSLNVKKK